MTTADRIQDAYDAALTTAAAVEFAAAELHAADSSIPQPALVDLLTAAYEAHDAAIEHLVRSHDGGQTGQTPGHGNSDVLRPS